VLATDKKLLSEVRSRFMRRLFEDSLGFAGTEMIRRILGLAKVADLETIADLKVKAACETKSLRMARELMVNSKTIRDIEGVAELAKRMQSGSAR
ncbi:MAG: S-methyl-5-thioribose kinase, partial [Bdellovibrionota bacterium]